MKVFKITDPTFKTEPLFIGNCTMVQMRQYIKKHFRYGYDEKRLDKRACGTVLTLDQPPWRVVWVRRMTRKPEDIANLVHELVHLCVRICDDKGIPIYGTGSLGENGDETISYMIEHFFQEAYKKIK